VSLGFWCVVLGYEDNCLNFQREGSISERILGVNQVIFFPFHQ
jgi:hypothetical protein